MATQPSTTRVREDRPCATEAEASRVCMEHGGHVRSKVRMTTLVCVAALTRAASALPSSRRTRRARRPSMCASRSSGTMSSLAVSDVDLCPVVACPCRHLFVMRLACQ